LERFVQFALFGDDESLMKTHTFQRFNIYHKIFASWKTPVTMFVLLSITTVFIYNNLQTSNKDSQKNETKKIQQKISDTVESYLSEIDRIEIGASEFVRGTKIDEKGFDEYASNQQNNKAISTALVIGYSTLGDSKYPTLQYVAPKSFVEAAGVSIETLKGIPLDLVLNTGASYQEAIQKASLVLTNPYKADTFTTAKEPLVNLLMPVYPADFVSENVNDRKINFIGMLIIPVTLSSISQYVTSNITQIKNLKIQVGDKSELAFNKDTKIKSYSHTSKTEKYGKTITVKFNYISQVRDQSSFNFALLVGGLFLSLMVALILSAMVQSEKKIARVIANSEKEVYKSEAKLSSLIEHSSDITFIVNNNGFITFVSPAIKSTGYSAKDLLGKSILSVCGNFETKREAVFKFRKLQKNKFNKTCEITTFDKSKKLKVFECSISDALGNESINGFVINSHDITERIESVELLDRLASIDFLTGVYNRRKVTELLEDSLQENTSKENLLAVYFIDLDKFKDVNDNFGHNVGDELLVNVAKRIKSVIKKSDYLGRLGGDEFITVTKNVSDRRTCEETAKRILNAISKPYFIAGENIDISASIGISISSEYISSLEVIKRADAAMYGAKSLGKDCIVFYDSVSEVKNA
jgi:diguanylate cyclase (GGDEF)-like protein/PAS domain S-box-containing protein